MAPSARQNPRATFPASALGLACGVLSGAIIAVAIEVIPSLVTSARLPKGVHLLAPPLVVAEISAVVALEYGVVIAVVGSVCWWVLGAVHRQTIMYAAALGGALTAGVWLLTNASAKAVTQDLLVHTCLFGMAGAFAGLVTWRVSHLRSRERMSPTAV